MLDDFTFDNTIIEEFNKSEDLPIILAITTDNISNNNTIFRYFVNHYIYNDINFDIDNQRVRCLAYIINLAAQDLLKNLKAEGPNENKILLDNEDISSTDFEKATINISGCKYSTIGLVILYYHDLLDVLEKYINNCSNLIIKEAIKKARTKLSKYYSDANSLISEYQPTQTSIAENISNEKNHESEFKYLSKIAKDYLSVQATSISAERVFSAAKELIISRRCNLNPTTIRA
ncbi:23958_t:CDS:2, partial [Racocetra persica]